MDKWNIQPFNFKALPTTQVRDAWIKYKRNFKYIALANEETNQTKLQYMFLAKAGPDVQEVFASLPGGDVGTQNQTTTPFDDVITLLDEYFAPRQHETFERHNFWMLKQNPEESLEKFLLRLTDHATRCNFGKTKEESAEISVIDKIILLAPPDLKERLLEKENLTLNELTKMVNSYSSVKFQASQMKPAEQPLPLNTISKARPLNNRYTPKSTSECSRCGWRGHTANDQKFPAKNKVCDRCLKTGHFAKRCKTPQDGQRFKREDPARDQDRDAKRRRINSIQHQTDSEEEQNQTSFLYDISDREEIIWVRVGGVFCQMMIDSGSAKNIIDEQTWRNLVVQGLQMKNPRNDSTFTFKPYGQSSKPLKVLKVFEADISVTDVDNRAITIATFFVVAEGSQSILGKDTAKSLGVLLIGLPSVRAPTINAISGDQVGDNVKRPFPKIKGVQLCIPIDKTVAPIAQHARRPPLALLDRIEEKLNMLLMADIIEPVQEYSQWVSSLVVIVKDNGDLRLCVDMRRANEAIRRENHLMPTFDDFLPRLKKAKFFSLLDVKEAFYQVELEESCRYITTFITHKGVFRYKRLMFGISCAPEMFQKIMEQILADCDCVINYIDDVFVFGETEQEHDEALRKVLEVFKSRGILLNQSKCVFKVPEITFVGHRLSSKGVQPTEEKTAVLKSFRAPSSAEELRSFLGLVTYVGRFLPDLATVTEPLRELLRKGVSFHWDGRHEEVFQHIKTMICNISHLQYFDNRLRTRLIADASPVALGAVLVQFSERDNIPRVVSYASKSLSSTEKRYCQTEKEALALVWAVERFSMYLLGREFELETDHKPLETIFSPSSKPCARIERWVLRLQSFKYNVKYRKGAANIADPFSRLPTVTEINEFENEGKFMVLAILDSVAVDTDEIERASMNDPELCSVRECMQSGNWTKPEVKPYEVFHNEMGIMDNIVVRGNKMVIPKGLRNRMLTLAHEGHPGESLMKRRLRDRMWWPGMDRDVTKFVVACEGCRLVGLPSRPEPMQRRPLPSRPWIDVALDFLGPLPSGEYLLVIIDYYSRYKEIEIMSRITAKATIDRLSRIFTRLGYPMTITLDNARQFVSAELEQFCSEHGVHLNNTTPYWPQENGLVERQNRSVLKRLQISQSLQRDWKADLNDYLMMYYTTPHSVTGKTPTELCYGRTIRSKLPSLQDIEVTYRDGEVSDRDQLAKQRGKERGDQDRRAAPSNIQIGDDVLMKNLLPSNKLTPTFDRQEFVVLDKSGSRVTIQNKSNEKIYQRNSAHLKRIPRLEEPQLNADSNEDQLDSQSTIAGDDASGNNMDSRVRRNIRRPQRFADYILDSETSSLKEQTRCSDVDAPPRETM